MFLKLGIHFGYTIPQPTGGAVSESNWGSMWVHNFPTDQVGGRQRVKSARRQRGHKRTRTCTCVRIHAHAHPSSHTQTRMKWGEGDVLELITTFPYLRSNLCSTLSASATPPPLFFSASAMAFRCLKIQALAEQEENWGFVLNTDCRLWVIVNALSGTT